MSISKVVISGKVVREPEKRFTPNNISVTTFSIMVKSSKSEENNFIRVITWRNLADTCAETIKKGQEVVVDGRLQISSYKDSNGADKRATEIDAVSVEVISAQSAAPSREKEPVAAAKPAYAKKTTSANKNPEQDDVVPSSASDFEFESDDLIDEDEIPF